MDFLGLVKEYWADIVKIFDMIYNRIKSIALGE